ncbi:monovalent cation/H(+) antiporter subunit G [Sphingosinicella rhizophila]|uniref:Monovalent cation/H(+) antiporter subunit G n=1 Tax=Sphingosinicella rhizophila TaxID=3050082 RepID=A0ABU3QCC1_9SPHN|nr:monovalent cation/H(+) antiporter subunit G [Sphingosinicella sp. GR2756]MDT9601061.1 monovalent cation/H(+) antiporter subunit G [Sphingosinicella sp. GR2756]
MIQAPDLPGWAALLVALLVVAGAAITLVGSFGLLRLKSFYERVHSPTLGTTAGTALIILGSMLCFSVVQTKPLVHELLIALLVTLTTPVTLMMLVRAAIYRDRTSGSEAVPPADGAPTDS